MAPSRLDPVVVAIIVLNLATVAYMAVVPLALPPELRRAVTLALLGVTVIAWLARYRRAPRPSLATRLEALLYGREPGVSGERMPAEQRDALLVREVELLVRQRDALHSENEVRREELERLRAEVPRG